ncbi:Rid family hydrolase [Streptomyces sp. NPDC093089]|uniref:Rid family hydrolase n=1 Tax=Streptomyces sp. NPDC093089 TaxID=3366024 RepID=UPI0037FD1E36
MAGADRLRGWLRPRVRRGFAERRQEAGDERVPVVEAPGDGDTRARGAGPDPAEGHAPEADAADALRCQGHPQAGLHQAEQVLRTIDTALAQAGRTFADVVRVRYLLPDRADFEPCRPVLRRAFGEVRPAGTMLVCGLADPRMKIETEVDARRAATA